MVKHSPAATRRAILLIAFVGLFVFFTAHTLRRIDKGHCGDFHCFYYAAQAMVAGGDPYAADDPYYDATTNDNRYIYPPLVAFLYTPLTGLSFHNAARVMLFIDAVMLMAAVLLSADHFARTLAKRRDGAAVFGIGLIATVVLADKFKNELQMLQTNAPMLLAFVLAIRWNHRRPIASGAALGFILNIKYLSLIFVPYLIWRRQWRALGSMAMFGIGLALLPALLTGWNANLGHLRTAFHGVVDLVDAAPATAGAATVDEPGRADIQTVTASFSVSITSAAARVLAGRPAVVVYGAVAAIFGGIFAAVAWLYRRNRLAMGSGRATSTDEPPASLEWAALLAVALLISPQTNMRHFLLALPLVTAGAGLLLIPGIRRAPLATALALIFVGLIFPPSIGGKWMAPAKAYWFYYGLPSWCLLAAMLIILSAGLRRIATMDRSLGAAEARDQLPPTN